MTFFDVLLYDSSLFSGLCLKRAFSLLTWIFCYSDRNLRTIFWIFNIPHKSTWNCVRVASNFGGSQVQDFVPQLTKFSCCFSLEQNPCLIHVQFVLRLCSKISNVAVVSQCQWLPVLAQLKLHLQRLLHSVSKVKFNTLSKSMEIALLDFRLLQLLHHPFAFGKFVMLNIFAKTDF